MALKGRKFKLSAIRGENPRENVVPDIEMQVREARMKRGANVRPRPRIQSRAEARLNEADDAGQTDAHGRYDEGRRRNGASRTNSDPRYDKK